MIFSLVEHQRHQRRQEVVEEAEQPVVAGVVGVVVEAMKFFSVTGVVVEEEE
jgi:hypothetical protein